MYLAWAIMRGLKGQLHRQESPAAHEDVRQRRITGRDFLVRECYTKLWEEDLSKLGNEFTRAEAL